MLKLVYMRWLVVCGLLLSGCSHEVDVYQPVPAPVITNQIKIKTLWSTSVGSGVGQFYSQLSPAYDDERVYAASRNGDVYALDKTDGSRIWYRDLDDEDENDDRRSARISGGLTIDSGRLYLTSENGYVYALDASDGSILWKYYAGVEMLSAPAVGLEHVYVLNISGELLCLDALTGAKVWQTSGDHSMISLRGNGSPVPLADVVIYGGANGRIAIVDAHRGVLLRQLNLGVAHGKTQLARLNDVTSTPLLISNELYTVAFNGDLQGFVLPQVQNLWARKYASYQNMAYDLSDLAITDRNSHVYGIIRMDGSERWVNSALTYRNVTAPAYYHDYVLVGDYEGYLYWIDSASGAFKASFQIDSSGLYTAALVDDDVVYIQSRDGDLYAITLKEE